MRRFHLFEIGEQPWCPDALRDGLTDYLTFMIELGKPYAAAAPLLSAVIRRTASTNGEVQIPRLRAARSARDDTSPVIPSERSESRDLHVQPRNDTNLTPEPPLGATEVVDLAAGAGGPWRLLAQTLEQAGTPVRVRLTDRYPNVSAYERLTRETKGRVSGDARPISADAVPADLTGLRTMFSAFHHFAPTDARQVLADAAAHGESIAIFEATRRDMRAVLVMFMTPLFVLLATPFIRPFRWTRLLLTYVVPVIPAATLFDGVVSCLRTYTPAELRALGEESAPDEYTWTAGEVGTGPIPVTYVIGEARVLKA